MKGSILFCAFFAIFLGSIHNAQIEMSASSRSVKECSDKVIETIFGEELLYIIYHDNLTHLLPFHVSNPKILVGIDDPLLPELPIYNVVIQASSLSIFQKTISYFSWTHCLRIRRFLVITDQNDLSKALLNECWGVKIKFVYVAVLAIDIKNPTKSFLLTGDPNDPLNYCGKQLNVFQNQSCAGLITNTIPKAARNYNGCPVIANINAMTPRYEFDPRPYTLHIAQEILNISFLNKVKKRTVDTVVLDSDKSLSLVVSLYCCASHVFARDNVVFVVPPADKMSYIELLIVAFKKEVWLSTIPAFVLFATTWYIISRFKLSLGTIIMNTLSITVCGSSNYIPSSSGARFLIICYIIYAIHIQTAYIAELTRLILSLPTGKEIESLEELVETDLSVWTDSESEEVFFVYLHFSFPNGSALQKFGQRSLGRYGGFVNAHNLTTAWYADKSFSFSILLKTLQSIELSLKVSPPPYFVALTTMNVFTTDNYAYLIDSMDEIIDKLTDSGLYDKLDQDRKFYAEAKKSQFVSEEEVVAISFKHVSGVFVVFGAGLLLSITLFFGELIVHRWMN